MNPRVRDLLKHSVVYGIGQVLTRLASVVLLPFYTRYLSPADYGATAILDLSAQVLGILIGGGLVVAANRFHFERAETARQQAVWWTSLIMVGLVATAVAGSGMVLRQPLADLTLGREVANGAMLWGLALATLWTGMLTQVPSTYIAARKWSTLSVALSFANLLLNVALNVYFLTVWKMGVAGVLLGNLCTSVVGLTVSSAVMVSHCGRMQFDRPLARELWQFGRPLVLTALLSTAMHQADRLILRKFFSLEDVGIYSLAYTLAQGLNTLILVPFSSIWGVVIYDIAKEPDAESMFTRIFEQFTYLLMLVLFGVSLFVDPLLTWLVPGTYDGVKPLVPILCLSFVFFSAHEHFRVPAMLAKRTVSLLLPYASAAVANIALCLLVVPRFGPAGAAWLSVVTYAIFSGVGLIQYRRIDRFDYPLVRCFAVLVAMSLSYAACAALQRLQLPLIWAVLLPVVVWTAWTIVLMRPLARYLWSSRAALSAA
jgi:O-antigen/teichoic acid export membrane protein